MDICPICGKRDRTDLKTALLALFIGILVGVLGGQFLAHSQLKSIYKDKVDYLEKSNDGIKQELRKSVPAKPKPGGISF